MEYITIDLINENNFDFEKINLVSLTYKGKLADKYECKKTGLIGYRFGVDRYISVPKTKKNLKIYKNENKQIHTGT